MQSNRLAGIILTAVLLAGAPLAVAEGDNAAATQAGRDHDLLQGACNAIRDAQQQSSCLEALVRLEEAVAQLPPRTPAEQTAARKAYFKKKYAAVLGAFAAIKTATANQVSYEKYLALVDAAANELAPLRPRAAAEAERQAIRSLDAAIEEYRQAAKNWEAAGKFGLPASSFVVPKWRLAREAVKQAEDLLLTLSQLPTK